VSDRPYKNDHVDYPGRIVPLRRAIPDRMVGESTGNACDARADESMYKPSTLGSASVDIDSVTAGEDKPFTLTYRTGSLALPTGTTVKFWMSGQGSLGTSPQIGDPDAPGFVEIIAPAGITFDTLVDPVRIISVERGENPPDGMGEDGYAVGPITIGLTLTAGELTEGDEIAFRVGHSGGFPWKRVVGRKEFKLIIALPGDAAKMRLPEPIRIKMKAQDAHHLDVLLPGSAAPGQVCRATFSVRDQYDNRVPYDGAIRVDGLAGHTQVLLRAGIGYVNFEMPDDMPLQISASCSELGLSEPTRSNACLPVDGVSLYFGDMHTHDHNSTSEGYTSDVYLWARDEKRLDFISVPVQVHRWIDNEKWFLVKHCNEYFLDEGSFVTFLAFEWQHSSCGDKATIRDMSWTCTSPARAGKLWIRRWIACWNSGQCTVPVRAMTRAIAPS